MVTKVPLPAHTAKYFVLKLHKSPSYIQFRIFSHCTVVSKPKMTNNTVSRTNTSMVFDIPAVQTILYTVYSMKYEGCPESIWPVWMSREPVAWPWCNLAASQRRTYRASVNSHSPVGLVSRQEYAVDWACVLCDRCIYNDRASRSVSLQQSTCPFYSSRAGFLGKASHHPSRWPPPPTTQICLPATSGFSQS